MSPETNPLEGKSDALRNFAEKYPNQFTDATKESFRRFVSGEIDAAALRTAVNENLEAFISTIEKGR